MFVDDARPELNPTFFGRRKELEWLFDRSRGRESPIVISGAPGIGKTALLRQFLASVRARSRPSLTWTLTNPLPEAMVELTARIDEMHHVRDVPEIVAIDQAEALNDSDMDLIARRLLNLKAIRTLIFATRRPPHISRAEILELSPLTSADAEAVLRRLLGTDFPADGLTRAAAASAGSPLALSLVGELARGRSPQQVARLLKGDIYDLDQPLAVPERQQLITEVTPRIIFANETLMERLRCQPQSVFELPPRKFEELIAELLSDLGYEVELTPVTRDGGKDILAYMSTPHGKVLCLVEAKKYRQDRSVGIELVRQLYGTLIDADASSAMLVTTSSFSPDARAFQQRHKYKLALRDYGNVVQWIQGYGGSTQRPLASKAD